MADGLEVPGLKATMSQVSPAKAAQIRSVVTGDLTRNTTSGLLCFERTVETTFVLPWDLNPKVQPEKLGVRVCDVIRGQLLDVDMLKHLEEASSINFNPLVVWQYRQGHEDWIHTEPFLGTQLETGYTQASNLHVFVANYVTFHVDYALERLVNTSTNTSFEIRRLAFAPLFPMKTEADSNSLYHAASLGFWGVHDRTALLQQAVSFTLTDPKAQYIIHERWSDNATLTTKTTPGFPEWERAKNSLCEAPQLHIFTLANIVQRPIIVYAHPSSAVGGVYLPLLCEARDHSFPWKQHHHLHTPLVLGYNASCNHFTPLVTFKGTKGPSPLLHPLCRSDGSLLHIHFLSAAQRLEDVTSLLSRVMYVDLLPPTQSQHTPSQTLSVVSMVTEMPEVMETLVKRYESLFL